MPGQPVPFRWIRGLSSEAQKDIERNFLALQQQITATAVYDAYVDPSIAADSPGTLTFQTPFAAIKYVFDTLGRNQCSIAWIRKGTGGTTTATETGNYTGTSTGFVTIEVIGADMRADSRTDVANPIWAMGTFTDSGKFLIIKMRGLDITTSITVSGKPFSFASCRVFADSCVFHGSGGASNANAPSLPSGYYRDCLFSDVSFGGNADYYWLRCAYRVALYQQVAFNQNMYTWNCGFFGRSDNTATMAINCQEFVASDSLWGINSTWSGTANAVAGTSWTVSNAGAPSTQRIYITAIAESGVANQAAVINFAVALEALWLEGNYKTLTVVAPVAAGGGNGRSHHIHASVETKFDITGPADVTMRTQQGANFLRGAGIAGSCAVWGDKAAGAIALSLVGVTDSVVSVSFVPYGTAGTGKAYAIDVASVRNVIIAEGQGQFPGVSTNAGATTLVIDHNGAPPTGPAGGDLSGTYPSPLIDLLTRAAAATIALRTRVTADTQNRFQIAADGTIKWGSGAAATDATLSRSAVGVLLTDSEVQALRAVNNTFFSAYVSGDTFARWRVLIDSGGAAGIGFGTGSAGTDVNMLRVGGRSVSLDSELKLSAAAANGVNLSTIEDTDSVTRWRMLTTGHMQFGSGAASHDVELYRSAADILATDDDFAINLAGKGLKIKEGTNAKMGVATLVAGTVTVSTTAVGANTRIFLTVQSLGTVATPKDVAVTARTAATSFTITSSDGTDTSVVAWMLVEPA